MGDDMFIKWSFEGLFSCTQDAACAHRGHGFKALDRRLGRRPMQQGIIHL
jgi:hypothetical protein